MNGPETELDFEAITRPVAVGPGRYALDVPDGWQQGRGAFGGLVLAALVRAIEARAASPDRPLRALMAALPGATMVGPAQIEVELLRIGSGQTTAAARLQQGGELVASATAVLARARTPDAEPIDALAPPALGRWQDLPAIPSRPPFPTFTRHLEYRSAGPPPLAGGEASTRGWVRFSRAFAVGERGAQGGIGEGGPHALSTGAYLAALIDAWWPANLTNARALRPMATVGFSLQLVHTAAEIDPSAPLAYSARTLAQTEGWAIEARELWHPDGRLLALNQQTIAIIK